MRMSQTDIRRSCEVLTMYVPDLSTARLRTGPWWGSSLTSGVALFGDHNVTRPFWCPTCRIALCGFCTNAVAGPSFVYNSPSDCPVETSVYLRMPAVDIEERRKWYGRYSRCVASEWFLS